MFKVRCPICERWLKGGSTHDWPDFPFCSARCRLIDLGRWLDQDYAIVPEQELEEPASDDEDSIP
jgi:hypothetical protein